MEATDRFERVPSLPKSTQDRQSLILTLLAGSIALALLSPMLWVVLQAKEVPAEQIFEILWRQETLDIFVNSIVLVALVTVGSILVGVPLAMLTVQTDLPFRRFWTVVSALPLVIPSYIGAFAFISATGSGGAFTDVLAPIGIERIPAVDGLVGSTIVLILFTYPYVYLTTRASLLSLDGRAIEAAQSLNHSRLSAFRRVTVPQLVPGVAAGSLLVALYTLSDFGTPSLMQYDVFTRMIYVEYRAWRTDFASILSLLLVALTVLILVAESRIERGEDADAYVNRGTDRPGTISLGYWKGPALAFCSTVAVLALVVPPAILLYWLGRSSGGIGGGYEFQWVYAWNSVSVSSLAAGVSVLAALPLAYLSARGDGRLASIPERASYVGYAVPGIVLGLGLIYLALNFKPTLFGYELNLYYTLDIIVFAYVVRFMPQAVGTLRSSVLQTDRKLVEAARTLGHSSFSAFRKIVLPLVMPGIVAGAALVFLTSMKELAATLLLRPPEFETLVTYIWLVRGSADYGDAALPALVLIGVSGLSMLVLLWRGYDVQE
ncbi:MAG: ABC transporter permease [Halovenus sp.]